MEIHNVYEYRTYATVKDENESRLDKPREKYGDYEQKNEYPCPVRTNNMVSHFEREEK